MTATMAADEVPRSGDAVAPEEAAHPAATAADRGETYAEQTPETLPRYLADRAPSAMVALGAESADDMECAEVGDGNINLVFVATNSRNGKKIIVKQAVPYVRCVGPSWPLTLDRSWFEYSALSAEGEACPEHVPKVHHFSKPMGLIAMEYIPPPNIILRKGLVRGVRYPTMAEDMGRFCANTLFKNSGLKLSCSELRKKVEFWSQNHPMCLLTEQVVFTEPYISAPNNRWTSPQLDGHKDAIESDTALKIAVSKLKAKFVTQTQALIHGDLHTGSVMCSPSPGQTRVIDPEFAFYGPMGFDAGAFVANLLLSYASQGGHGNGDDYAEWVLEQVNVFWTAFRSGFLALWDDPEEHTGGVYQRRLFGEGGAALGAIQEEFMAELFRDTLGFAGAKMLRRIVGIAHVEDLESIGDVDSKARCEIHGLEIGMEIIKSADKYLSMEGVIQMAREKKPVL